MSIIRVQASVLQPLLKGFGCSAPLHPQRVRSPRPPPLPFALLKSSDVTGDFCSQSRQPSPRSHARRGVRRIWKETDRELMGAREARTRGGVGTSVSFWQDYRRRVGGRHVIHCTYSHTRTHVFSVRDYPISRDDHTAPGRFSVHNCCLLTRRPPPWLCAHV